MSMNEVQEIRSLLSQLYEAETQVNSKLAQPTTLLSSTVTIDNTGGSSDLTQPLFAESTPSRRAKLLRSSLDTGTVYIGGPGSQEYPFNPGDSIETYVADLTVVYVRVPAGGAATIYVLREV